MKDLVSLIMIGVSLSMDTFSLSLSLGSLFKSKLIKYIPFTVGAFHFFMPLLGNRLGLQLVALFNLASHTLLGFILIILGINLAIHLFKEEDVNINLNIIGVLLFSLSVSIDSFTVGMGMSAITSKYYFSSLVFAICSICFTYLGILIGKYSSKYIGKYANFTGIIILLILGIYHLFS